MVPSMFLQIQAAEIGTNEHPEVTLPVLVREFPVVVSEDRQYDPGEFGRISVNLEFCRSSTKMALPVGTSEPHQQRNIFYLCPNDPLKEKRKITKKKSRKKSRLFTRENNSQKNSLK